MKSLLFALILFFVVTHVLALSLFILMKLVERDT